MCTKTSSVPIVLQYEHKLAVNMTLIDTPGILPASEAEARSVEELIVQVLKHACHIL